MLSNRQRIAVYLLAALSVTMLLHVHAALESGSNHCAVCVQQSHGIVEQVAAVSADERVLYADTVDQGLALRTASPRDTNPRAPPA